MRLSAGRAWLAVGLLAISFNLRPAIVAVSPLLATIQRTLGLSSAGVGLLTALPLLCFGLLAPFAPGLVRRFGIGGVLLGCLLTLFAGVLLRSLPTLAAVFGGTLLIGTSVAIANVAMPGILKEDFPNAVGILSGLYTMMLSAGAAIAAGATVPLYRSSGRNWHLAIGYWAVPIAVAILLWLPSSAKGHREDAESIRQAPVRGVWRSGVAWSLTLFMGVQSFEFYATITWLPTIFHDRGTPNVTAGYLLALMNVAGILGALVAPSIAYRMTNQRLMVSIGVGSMALGTVGLLFVPHHLDILWSILIGAGQGSSIGLALMMMVLRAGSRDEEMALSGMAQGLGYLIASLGPVIIGGLFDMSKGWTLPLAVLLALLVVEMIAGDYAAQDRTVISATRAPAESRHA